MSNSRTIIMDDEPIRDGRLVNEDLSIFAQDDDPVEKKGNDETARRQRTNPVQTE